MGSESKPLVEDGTASLQDAGAPVETEKSRRALLKGLGVAAAGAVVGVVLSPREAAAHGTFHVDSNDGQPAIHGNNSSNSPLGPGVEGTSEVGFGVHGVSPSGFGVRGASASGTGVFGHSNVGPGVVGDSFDGVGVEARSISGIGVGGFSDSGTGVKGHSTSGIGVEGRSDTGIAVDGFSERFIAVNGSSNIGIGVEGRSDSGVGVDAGGNVGVNAFGGSVGVVAASDSGGTGVLAQNFGSGLALNVVGPAKFSTAGAGTIPAQQSSVVVSDPAVTADSHITMTLTGDPGSSASGLPAVLVWIERQPGTGFIARFSRRVASATPFTYLIIEPG